MTDTIFCQREQRRFAATEFIDDVHKTDDPHTTAGIPAKVPVESGYIFAMQKVEGSYNLRPEKTKP